MKVIKEGETEFDNMIFTVRVTGREVAYIYAALMNLSGDNFNRTSKNAGYDGEEMVDTDEIDTQSWRGLIEDSQRQ